MAIPNLLLMRLKNSKINSLQSILLQDLLQLEMGLKIWLEVVLMVLDAESGTDQFVSQELWQVAESHNYLPSWIQLLYVLIMIFPCALMEEIKTLGICVKLWEWGQTRLWLGDLWLVVKRVLELLLIKMENLLKYIEEWPDVKIFDNFSRSKSFKTRKDRERWNFKSTDFQLLRSWRLYSIYRPFEIRNRWICEWDS